jgi:hypothetical protein
LRRSVVIDRERTRSPFATLFARLGVVLAALALLSQSLAAVVPHSERRDARAAAAELTALFGPGVVICTQADDPGAPPKPQACDDRCPLCRVAADSFAFAARFALAAPDFVRAFAPSPPPQIFVALAPPPSPLPRGPPSPT